MAAVVPFVVPLVPLAVPRIGKGFRAIAKKYSPKAVAPVKPVTNAAPFKGQFPERDILGGSVLQHLIAAMTVANQCLLAAMAILDDDKDSAYVPGLCIIAGAFLLDMATHCWIVGGEDAKAIDGNVLQKGHAFSQAAFAGMIAAANMIVIGESNPSGLSKIPDLGWKTMGARFFMNPKVLIPLNLWQSAHALGVFGKA